MKILYLIRYIDVYIYICVWNMPMNMQIPWVQTHINACCFGPSICMFIYMFLSWNLHVHVYVLVQEFACSYAYLTHTNMQIPQDQPHLHSDGIYRMYSYLCSKHISVLMYIYMFVLTYICWYIHIYLYIYVCVNIYIYKCLRVFLFTCVKPQIWWDQNWPGLHSNGVYRIYFPSSFLQDASQVYRTQVYLLFVWLSSF